MNQQQTQTTSRTDGAAAASLSEQHALLQRLKELRSQGQQAEARRLARYLELLDQADDWSMRYSA
jgi:hypothetical protein